MCGWEVVPVKEVDLCFVVGVGDTRVGSGAREKARFAAWTFEKCSG